MSGLQFTIALLTALVAPIALYFQQRGQNSREVRMRKVDADFQAKQLRAEAARSERQLRLRDRAERRFLRAVHTLFANPIAAVGDRYDDAL